MSTLFLSQVLQKLYFHFHPLFLLPSLMFIVFLYQWLFMNNNGEATPTAKRNLPPSPPKLPVLGNFHQLSMLPHISLGLLSEQYGKLMLLHFGSKPTLVISCPSIAKEVMRTHDIVFANRPKLHFVNKVFYDGNDIAFGQYGEHWRHMKGVALVQLLSTKKVQSFRTIREEEVGLMIRNIKGSLVSSSLVNLSEVLFRLMLDLVNRTALGRKCSGDRNDKAGTNFEQLIIEITKIVGSFSVGDYFPWLGWIDRLTGLKSRTEKIGKDFDQFLRKVIQEHEASYIDNQEANNDNAEQAKDFVDVLLQVQQENPTALSMDSIKGLLLDIFLAGTETTYTLMEWTIAELLKHPTAMKHLEEEVRGIVEGKKRLNEDDLENMKYLKATIKETLRLHPPAPLLIFRESSQDVKVNDYDIATGTQVIINVAKIQSDPTYWEEPEEFRPERFLNSSIDFKGQHFQFIPFGAGRRGCPGATYSMAIAELVIASLIYEFDLKLPGGVAIDETLDMAECTSITIRKKHPLILAAFSRAD